MWRFKQIGGSLRVITMEGEWLKAAGFISSSLLEGEEEDENW